MSDAWTCPVCGTVWSADTTQCFQCRPAADAPGAVEPALPLPEPAPIGLPYPPPPEPLPQRNSRRPFGALLTTPFGIFADHFTWLASITLVVLIPTAVSLGWLIQSWIEYQTYRYSRIILEVRHQAPPDRGWGDARGPDGLKQDRQGRLYVAAGLNVANPPCETADRWTGGIYVLSPDGELLQFIGIPTDEVTNCAFGGRKGRTLYVTAGGKLWEVGSRGAVAGGQ